MPLNLTQSNGPAAVEEHLSPERLALLFNCSLSKVRKAIQRGELDSVRVGRLIRVPTSAVHRWLEATRPR
jgi:excisionase family DNA binding protein